MKCQFVILTMSVFAAFPAVAAGPAHAGGASKAQTVQQGTEASKPAKVVRNRTSTMGNTAMPMWEGPWGDHH